MPDTVPQIFASYELRNRILNRNLSHHPFTVVEKVFLGSEAGELTSLLEWGSAKFTVLTKISNRYTIPVSTVREWMQKVADNLQITSRIGRPPALDAEAIANFQSILEMRRTVRNAVPLAEAFTLLEEAVMETKMRSRCSSRVKYLCNDTEEAVQKVQCCKIEASNPDGYEAQSLSLSLNIIYLGMCLHGLFCQLTRRAQVER